MNASDAFACFSADNAEFLKAVRANTAADNGDSDEDTDDI
jgi:hypothetical protein